MSTYFMLSLIKNYRMTRRRYYVTIKASVSLAFQCRGKGSSQGNEVTFLQESLQHVWSRFPVI